MATKSTSEFKTPALPLEARTNLVNYVNTLMTTHRMRSDMYAKMEAIDQAYARYNAGQSDGNEICEVNENDRVTPPIVVSQVDSMVAYLSEVYLSGSPLFPVVSTYKNRKAAEELEVLMDDHSLLGGYPRELMLFIRNAVKYNFGPLEVDWGPIQQFSVAADFTNTDSGRKVEATRKYYNQLKGLDPYNTIWDSNVLPSEVAKNGDYAGYIEMYSYVRLKRLIADYQIRNKVYDIDKAIYAGRQGAASAAQYYRQKPDISDMGGSYAPHTGSINWEAWLQGKQKRSIHNNTMGYEVIKLYLRLLPSDFGIPSPQANTAQIWKVILVNGKLLVAERVISAYDYLPILIGQAIEDGFGVQTQGVAEGEMEFQEAAAKLFNIRFSAARRAVSDRAIYAADAINPKDVNSKQAAPKIPVQLSSLANQTLDSVYKQIPFDMRGLETTLNDAQTIVNFSKDLHGQNSPRQGQFQRGNKSVREWTDTMSGSEERLRMPALSLEYQVFSPMKSMMALNIFQFSDDVKVVSQKTGDVLEINISELRKQVLSFRMADGYSPKSKLASTEVLTQGMQLILGSELLQQSYGPALPGMFAHIMSLGGVRGLEQYAIQAEQARATPPAPAPVTPASTIPVQQGPTP